MTTPLNCPQRKPADPDAHTLKLHLDQGRIWYADGNQGVRCSGQSPEEFLEGPFIRPDQSVRALGLSSNVRLLMYLYDLKQKERLASVEVCSPLAAKVDKQRRNPEAAIISMRRFTKAASLGGFHEFTEMDYRAYALAQSVHEGMMLGEPVDERTLRLLRAHPAWKPLSFVENLNRVAVAGLLSYILDPRYYVDDCKPDSQCKLEAFLGLNPRTQAGVSGVRSRGRHHSRCKVVLECWKDHSLVQLIRDTYELHTPVPIANNPKPGWAPYDFVWREWGRRMGYGNPDAPMGDPIIADLRASQRLITFVRQVWLGELYRNSPAAPDGRASLFRPSDFFQHPTEIAAYEMHQIKHEMI